MPKASNALGNLATHPKAEGVYIGRKWAGREASEWANPFKVIADTDQDRRDAIWRYFRWILDQPQRFHIHELQGRPLLCWCAPRPCHGQALAFILAHQEFAGQPCPMCRGPLQSRMNFFENGASNVLYEQGPCPKCLHYRFRHAAKNVTVDQILATPLAPFPLSEPQGMLNLGNAGQHHAPMP